MRLFLASTETRDAVLPADEIEAVKYVLISFYYATQKKETIERIAKIDKEYFLRVVGYWKELLEGQQYTNREIAEMYNKKFVVPNNTLVVKQIKNVFSHCEHHLALMYNMTVIVAYLPKPIQQGFQVIGLSKIPRIVDMCCKRLQLQEKLAEDIAECISIATESEDVYVNIVADHACVSARGAKSDGITDVTSLHGEFKTDAKLREEIGSKIK